MRTKAHLDILRRMEEVMGPCPAMPKLLPPFTVDSDTEDGGLLRRHILIETEPGDKVPAWLLVPPNPLRKKMPAALCLHQTTKIGKDEPAGLGGNPNLHYARELALKGFITLAPDYPNFGEYRIDPYARGYASATMKGIFNHRRALDLLSNVTYVDRLRIGVCGHSLGGHNALFAAAFDERVRAVITSCGFTSFAKYYGGDLTGWSHKGYMPRIAEKYEKSPAKMPFDFHDVLSAIAPRPVFVNAPLRDANFDASGADDAVAASHHKGIEVVHPDSAHDFPPEVRLASYAWLEKRLTP